MARIAGVNIPNHQHAEIAQMRAIETGSWVLRAAATGISGIVAPTGRYVREAALDRMAIVEGKIGPPARAPYATLGALPVGLALALLYLVVVVPRRA